jgi:toluene monooxygenase system protein B
MTEATSTQPNGSAADVAAEPEPSLIPLNAVFADDFLEILVPVMSNNTIAELAGAVAVHVEGVRVPVRDREKAVFHNGRRLDPAVTVAEAGIAPLDHVRVDYVS